METTALDIGDYVKFKHEYYNKGGPGKIVAFWVDMDNPWSVKMKDYNGDDIIIGCRSKDLIKITKEEALLWKLQTI